MDKRRRTGAMARSGWLTGLLILGMLLPMAAAASGRLYRYTNDQGWVEISHAVPAHRAAGGYQVLDARTGRVIETVAPQLSASELQAQQARERDEAACRQAIDRVTTLYGSVQDIDVAQQQADRALETRIAHTETNLGAEQRRLEEHQREAAQQERTGRPVSEALLEGIARSRAQIRSMEQEIEQRRNEQVEAGARFAEDRRLFESGSCEAVSLGRVAP